LTHLSKSELIISVQGKGGGYRIAKSLSEISLLDIVGAVDDTALVNDCFFGHENCGLKTKCVMHDKWFAIRKNIRTLLIKTSLAEFKNEDDSNILNNNNLLNH
jgi:Rrf2 family iron-sulfur cluster assembly transcriptional regulator